MTDLADLHEAAEKRRQARRRLKEVVLTMSREELQAAWDSDLLTVWQYEEILKIKHQQDGC